MSLNRNDYVLITAARNEENFIGNTVQAIIAQTILPRQWIIVSDGSTDKTDEIVSRFAKKNGFITLMRTKRCVNGKTDFSSKVFAIKAGYEKLNDTCYDFIGILDADVTFDSRYYENILNAFTRNTGLGIAGGVIFDQYDNHCTRRSPDHPDYVSGCIQFFRRECFEDIDGLTPMKDGGEDTIAVIKARMRGWDVKAFEECKVFHHKHSTAQRGVLNEMLREGRMFYSLGSHPLFEILKSIKNISRKPYFLYPVARMAGYAWPYFKRQKRSVSEDFIKFLRNEQLARLKFSLKKKS